MASHPSINNQPNNGRNVFQHNGQTVYEWDQTLEEVNIYIQPPAGVKKAHLDIQWQPRSLSVGLKGNPPFIKDQLFSLIDTGNSYWMIEDGILHIQLGKVKTGEMWDCVMESHGTLNPLEREADKKKLMLERFQKENPQFDFSSAEFNGSVPDARTFMGGVKY